MCWLIDIYHMTMEKGRKKSYDKQKHEALKSTKINVIPKKLAFF